MKRESRYEQNRIFELNEPNAPRLNPALAKEIGLNESILFLQLEFWIAIAPDRNIRDGRKWVYKSLTDLLDFFPFWSKSTLNRVINSLKKEKKLIHVGEYNEKKYDRTRWFAINFEEARKLKSIKVANFNGVELDEPETRSVQGETHSAQSGTDSNQTETTIQENTIENTSESTNINKEVKYLSDQTRSRKNISLNEKNFEPEDESDFAEVYSSVKEVLPPVKGTAELNSVTMGENLSAPAGRNRGLILTDKTNDRVRPVYDFWLKALNRHPARNPLTDEARWTIAARLKDGFPEDELKLAVLGCMRSLDIRDYYIVRGDDGEPRFDKYHPKQTSLKHIFGFSDRTQKFLSIALDCGCEVADIEDEDYSPDEYGEMSLEFDGEAFWTEEGDFFFEYDNRDGVYEDEYDYYMTEVAA